MPTWRASACRAAGPFGVLFCQLTNSVVGLCDEAISSLCAVSVCLVRLLLAELVFLCAQAAAGGDTPAATTPRPHGLISFRAHSQSLNRFNQSYEKAVRIGLALHLRANPAFSSVLVSNRLCLPEVNTVSKIARAFVRSRRRVPADSAIPHATAGRFCIALLQSGEALFSHCKMQRMIDRYL